MQGKALAFGVSRAPWRQSSQRVQTLANYGGGGPRRRICRQAFGDERRHAGRALLRRTDLRSEGGSRRCEV